MSNKITFKKKPDSKKAVEDILTPEVKKWFFSRFKEFSLPQLYGVSEIHSRQNVLISAPTGATKTLTAFLSILNELADSANKGILEDKVYCVYISPLKALNYDIEHNLKTPLKEIEEIYGKKLGIRVAVRTGDTTAYEKQKMLKNPPHILITTPESLALMLSSPKFVNHLHNVEWCIIDEVHALADNKRGVHLSLSVERLALLSDHMTRVGLSATISPLDQIANFLVGNENDCKIVDVQFIKDMDLKVLSPVPDLINITYDDLHNKMYDLVNKLVQDHKTTLIFTNTRAATERVVHYLKERFPKHYNDSNIGAHHGSLSKEHRFRIESQLREGKLKVVVSSTSLELGIDIGFIDLVILLMSPKSVARALQRVGRSGHQLHSTTKGRIIVMDRDDLIECAVLLKNAVEKKIDRIHIPMNCLDVLAQQVNGMAVDKVWEINEIFKVVKRSYCFKDLVRKDFDEVVDYLSGKYVSLEDRHVYARVWNKEGKIGRRGKMARVIYMTNIGTIPDERAIHVKIGERIIGTIDEGFLEKLRKGDVFVLGGSTFRFLYSRGMTVQVVSAYQNPPTVPSWFSEMLPLSFDLALSIGRFRALMFQHLKKGKKESLKFVHDYLYVDKVGGEAIYNYFKEMDDYVGDVPSDKKVIVEHYSGEDGKKVIFHSLYGRRVNDCLSRAVAFAIARSQHKDVNLGMNDNGFFIGYDGKVNVMQAFNLLKHEDFVKVMNLAVDESEVLKRRFRHCAMRALMILRNYAGRKKSVGRQQMSSMLLLSAVRRISNDFIILKEARREVLDDLMDIDNALLVVKRINEGKIKVKEIFTSIPTPFAFNLALQGFMDVLKVEDKVEFIRRMHNNLLAKISLDKGKKKIKEPEKPFTYDDLWKEEKN